MTCMVWRTVPQAHFGDLCRNFEDFRDRTLWPHQVRFGDAFSFHRRRILPKAVVKIGNNEFQRFLQIASGSASELDYELLLAKDLGYLAHPDYSRIANFRRSERC